MDTDDEFNDLDEQEYLTPLDSPTAYDFNT